MNGENALDNQKSTSISDCCGAKMIPPDFEIAKQAGSLWKAWACYICKKCGKSCKPITINPFSQ